MAHLHLHRKLRSKAEEKRQAEMRILNEERAETITLLNQHNSPLLRLPGEIRNIVYTFALSGNVIEKHVSEHPRTTAQAQSTTPDTKKTFAPTLSLLAVSRQVYFETRILLFELATLRIRKLEHILGLWREMIGPQWNAITTFRISTASIRVSCPACRLPFCPWGTEDAAYIRKERLEALSNALGLRRVIVEDWERMLSVARDDEEKNRIELLIKECAENQEVEVVFETRPEEESSHDAIAMA